VVGINQAAHDFANDVVSWRRHSYVRFTVSHTVFILP